MPICDESDQQVARFALPLWGTGVVRAADALCSGGDVVLDGVALRRPHEAGFRNVYGFNRVRDGDCAVCDGGDTTKMLHALRMYARRHGGTYYLTPQGKEGWYTLKQIQ